MPGRFSGRDEPVYFHRHRGPDDHERRELSHKSEMRVSGQAGSDRPGSDTDGGQKKVGETVGNFEQESPIEGHRDLAGNVQRINEDASHESPRSRC